MGNNNTECELDLSPVLCGTCFFHSGDRCLLPNFLAVVKLPGVRLTQVMRELGLSLFPEYDDEAIQGN